MSEENIITINGIDYTVNVDFLEDDYELVELLDEIEERPTRYPRLIKRVTGDKYEATKDSLRNERGKVTMEAMGEWWNEYIEKVAELKN